MLASYLVELKRTLVIRMITFACKRIRQEELIRCSFNLNKTEYNVLMFILKRSGNCTVSMVSESMGLERTTVQKAVKTLFKRRLVKRMQKNLSKGGYIYYYKISNKNEIKNEMKNIVYMWYKGVEKEIGKL